MTSSLISSLASLPEDQQAAILSELTEQQANELLWDWQAWARPEQLPPDGDWLTWLVLAGRGFGKTRCGCEWIRSIVCGKTPLSPGTHHRIAIVAETAADARDVLVEGDSGLLSIHPPDFRPFYEPSKRRLTWPNGAIATLYNAVEPDQLRGPQHDAALCDELAKWRYARETWDQLQFGLRLGHRPRQVVTTTPRPIPVLKEILQASSTVTTKGSTYDNRDNLAKSFLDVVVKKYEGTRLGRQELQAEILDDLPGALWNRKAIDDSRVPFHEVPELQRIVVAIDPSGTDGAEDDKANEVGIVVAALGVNGHGYILSDRSCNMSPDGWGNRAVRAYHGEWAPDGMGHLLKADCIVAERNFGGAMVKHVIKTIDDTVPYKEVTASRGKILRAEPVAALYEQKRVHHVGSFPELEDQMCLMEPAGYAGEGSPDRVDAAVWAITELMLDDGFKYGMMRVVN